MAGHLNGSGRGQQDDGKIASLDEARRRAAARAKEKIERSAEAPRRAAAMSTRDWVIGGVFVLMALGLAWHWLAPLMGAKGLVR